MKRKDLLLLSLVLLLLGAAVTGLFWYRSTTEAGSTQTTSGEGGSKAQQLPTGTPAVSLWVTRDYGQTEMIHTVAPIQQGDTVMDILKRHGGEIKTSYNGTFVESIGGLASAYRVGDSSSKKLDWFFYVNGIMSDIGAAEYPVQAGDVIRWDYHNWDFSSSTPAEIGVYPQPFMQRENDKLIPLTIMYAPAYKKDAEQIAASLSRKRNEAVTPVEWDEKQFANETALIVIADNKSLAASAFYARMWEEKEMFGIFAHATEQGIETYDTDGKLVKSYTDGDVGVIISTIHPETRRPLWMITGTTQAGIAAVAKSLESTEEDYPWMNTFGILQTENDTVRLPILSPAGGTP